MSDLFAEIRTVLEFILLGGMFTIVLAYAFIWIHPLKDAVNEYWKRARSFLFGERGQAEADSQTRAPRKREGSNGRTEASLARTVILTALAAGYLYFAGSVTNVVGYWLVEPAHNADLARFYMSLEEVKPKECPAVPEAQTWKDWVYLNRLVWCRANSECAAAIYRATLREEAVWRTLARESAEDTLGGLVKHIRLARGAALCALGIGVLALLKTLGALFVRFGPKRRSLYKALVDPNVKDGVAPEEIHWGTYKAIAVYLLTAFLCAAVYLVGMQSYMNAEREFHGFVHFGAREAQEKLRAETSKAQESSGQQGTGGKAVEK